MYKYTRKDISNIFLQVVKLYVENASWLFKCFSLVQTSMYTKNSLEGYICENI